MATGDTLFGKSFPMEYGNNNADSTGLAGAQFGFGAGLVRVENLGAGSAYISMRSTGPASTGGYRVSSGQVFEYHSAGAATWGMSWATTSTGTVLNIGAWG